MRLKITKCLSCLVLALGGVLAGQAQAVLPDGNIWLSHARNDLLPFWTMPDAQGKPVGRFPTFRCNDGKLFRPETAGSCPELQNPPSSIKAEIGRDYVRMQSRQIYAYAMGFHLTGDVKLLKLAQAGARDLHQRAFDPATGSFASWYADGTAGPEIGLRTSQDLSQAALGLAALFYLTHDSGVLADLIKLRNHVFITYRNPKNGMIKWVTKDDGSGEINRQELVALLDQLNAYLVLVSATLPDGNLKKEWLQEVAVLSKAIVDQFYDLSSGRFFGTRDQPDSEGPRGRNNDFGYTAKSFWMLYLGARMNRDDKLMTFARDGMRKVLDAAYIAETGSWGSRMKENGEIDAGKEWWIYAELDQVLATLAVEQGDSPERLEKTWRFWLDNMVDAQHGEVWGWVGPNGVAPANSLKQHHWKNGFHSMEHALIGYIAGQALNQKPATLYFALPSGRMRPVLKPYTFEGKVSAEADVQSEGVTIQKVSFEISNGKRKGRWQK